jgi:allantoinase
LEAIAKWLCENPAKLPGLANKKGKIEIGYDADLVVWDPGKKFTVSPEMLLHRHKITPYMGEVLDGVIEQVYLAGELVYDDGKFLNLNKGGVLKF